MKRKCSDDGGGIAVYAALGMAAFMGVGALAIDIGRFMHLHTDLQSAADAAALAGAAELNGEAALPNGMLGARARAEAAAKNALFANTQTFATDGAGEVVAVSGVEFLSSLSPTTAATSDLDAAYIRVTVAERTVTGSLIRPLLGEQNLTTSASAVAGMDTVACAVPPLMLCNPNEDPVLGGGEFTIQPGQLIWLKAQGSGSSWAPGEFSLLDTPDGSQGTKDLTEQLASNKPKGCYLQSAVGLAPGQKMPTADGINVRFDIYDGQFDPKKMSTDDFALYAPDVNVTKGKVVQQNSCTITSNTKTLMPMPLDTCFTGGGCGGNGRVGDGNWDRAGYWTANNGMAPPSANITRYETYLYENKHGIPEKAGGESGKPVCAPAGEAERRVIHVAVVNCKEQAAKGNKTVRAKAFARLFVTRPMLQYPDDPDQASGKNNLWAELIDIAEAGEDDAIHNIIQLYR